MNQEKIGKFICLKRKEKKLTQQELAIKLGVTDRAVSKWERGRGMPDYSLIQKLCEELDISINDLLSGEENSIEYEKNILNTIHDADKRIIKKTVIIGIVLIILGIILIIFSFAAFKSESSWGSIISIIGLMISVIGLNTIIKKWRYFYKILLLALYTIIMIILLFMLDYLNVKTNLDVPRFRYSVMYYDNIIMYQAPFYNVFRINYDTKNEYIIIDNKKEYDIDTVPNIPFNYNKCNIDELIKYRNNLNNDFLKKLPLNEYYDVYDLKNNSLIITYKIEDRYLKKDYYLYQSLFYNTMAIYALNDHIDEISFCFLNNKYYVTREIVKDNFDRYDYLMNKYLNINTTFKMYVEDYFKNDLIIADYFKKYFIDTKLVNAKIVVSYNYDGMKRKVISNQSNISKLIKIFVNGHLLSRNANVNLESNTWNIILFDKNNKEIIHFLVWQNGFFGIDGKEYGISILDKNDLIKILS